MKKTILLTVIITSFMNLAAQQADYIIRNGKLIDGSGNNWQYKDVAIQKNEMDKVQIGDCIEVIISLEDENVQKWNKSKGPFKCP